MSEKSAVVDVVLTQRFLPEYGGSIRWLHEVYRRWPGAVRVVTHDYARFPPPGFAKPEGDEAAEPVTDGNLTLDRRDILMDDWGIQSPRLIARYLRMTRAVGESFDQGKRVRVHCGHAVPEVVSLIPLKWRYGNRLQVVCYAHGEEITACRSSRQLTFLMKRAHRIVDLMIANSESTATLLGDGFDERRLAIVHPGVEMAEFSDAEPLGDQWRREHGLMENRIVLTMGRLDPRKNHEAVIRALAGLRSADPDRYADVVYVIAGDGRESGKLEELAKELGVADRVRFLGRVDGSQRIALFGACDVFAMPAVRRGTDLEGFGMVFIEAGACGKPSIAGKVGGQAEAVRDGETGLVVDGESVEAVSNGLVQLLSDGDAARVMGERARRWAGELDWSGVVQRTVELVEELE